MKAAPQHHAKDRISPNKTFPKSACKIYYRLHSAKFASAIVTSQQMLCIPQIHTVKIRFEDALVTVASMEEWHFCRDLTNKVHIKALHRNIKTKNTTLAYSTIWEKSENLNSLSFRLFFLGGGGRRRLQILTICKNEMEA